MRIMVTCVPIQPDTAILRHETIHVENCDKGRDEGSENKEQVPFTDCAEKTFRFPVSSRRPMIRDMLWVLVWPENGALAWYPAVYAPRHGVVPEISWCSRTGQEFGPPPDPRRT